MRKLILHIGRHKTGTTAVQRFLHKNRQWLGEQELYYPEYGIRGFGHHEIGAAITRRKISDSECSADTIVNEIRNLLDCEIGSTDSTIVISSEAFQNCDPILVNKLFTGFDIKVVVYLREQVRYLVSAYIQKVQATEYTGSLDEFHEANSYSTYKDFLDKWDAAFPGRLWVRNYDRAELLDGNVVVDFGQQFLHLDPETVKSRCERSDANPSLTRDLVDFKLRLNKCANLHNDQSRMVFTGLAKLAVEDTSGAMPVSAELASKIAHRYRESNVLVARRYFDRNELFSPFTLPEDVESPIYPEVRLARIREQLVSMSPELDGFLPDAKELGSLKYLENS